MAEWAADVGSPGMNTSAAAAGGNSGVTDEIADRTSVITARLKTIYRKSVLPVEKKCSYDYFYESPLLTDIEFDGTNSLCEMTSIFLDSFMCLIFGSKRTNKQMNE